MLPSADFCSAISLRLPSDARHDTTRWPVMVTMEEILVANPIWLPLSPRRVMVDPSADTSQTIDSALPLPALTVVAITDPSMENL